MATWIIDAAPLKAYGACGKNGRVDAGTCNDHFNLLYSFPNDVLLSFTGTQFGAGSNDIGCQMFGSQGMIETHYFTPGITRIVGHKSYKGGIHKSLYGDGAISNIAAFFTAIGKGDYTQCDRGAQRSQQSDHDSRPHGCLQEGRSHVGRNDESRRETRLFLRRAEKLKR